MSIPRAIEASQRAAMALDKLDLGLYRPAGSDESDPTTPTGIACHNGAYNMIVIMVSKFLETNFVKMYTVNST